MAHRGDALEAETPLGKDMRVVCPTEAERLLGFPDDWTYLESTDANIRSGHNRRKHAVGNAVAVPVIALLLTAVALCLQPAVSSASSLWLDPLLAFTDVPRHRR